MCMIVLPVCVWFIPCVPDQAPLMVPACSKNPSLCPFMVAWTALPHPLAVCAFPCMPSSPGGRLYLYLPAGTWIWSWTSSRRSLILTCKPPVPAFTDALRCLRLPLRTLLPAPPRTVTLTFTTFALLNTPPPTCNVPPLPHSALCSNTYTSAAPTGCDLYPHSTAPSHANPAFANWRCVRNSMTPACTVPAPLLACRYLPRPARDDQPPWIGLTAGSFPTRGEPRGLTRGLNVFAGYSVTWT